MSRWWDRCLLRSHGCCGCLDLRGGSLVVAVLTLAFGAAGVAGLILHLVRDGGGVSWVVVFNAVNCVVVLLSGSLLLLGALRKTVWSVRWYLPLSLYTLVTFVFWLVVAIVCAVLSFTGLVEELLVVLGGLSHRDQARLKVQGRDGTQLELLTDGDTRRLVGFSFSAAAVVLVVFIAIGLNFLSVVYTFYVLLKKEERGKKMSPMEDVIAERDSQISGNTH